MTHTILQANSEIQIIEIQSKGSERYIINSSEINIPVNRPYFYFMEEQELEKFFYLLTTRGHQSRVVLLGRVTDCEQHSN